MAIKTVKENIRSLQVEDDFHQHATRAIALICVVLGIISVIVPIIYGVNPWTGILFTIIALWAYWQSTKSPNYRLAAIAVVAILTISAFLVAIIHGLYGALGFFLIFLSSLVASITLSNRVGIFVFSIQMITLVPFAIRQYADKNFYETTPVFPDALMAMLIAIALYIILRIFNNDLILLRARQHAYKRKLSTYDKKMESILKRRLAAIEKEINEKTRMMRLLATRGRELSHLTHDASNALMSLRFLLDENMNSLPMENRSQVDQSLDYLEGIIQKNRHLANNRSSVCSVNEVIIQCSKTFEKSFQRKKIALSISCPEQIISVRKTHLQRILNNIFRNSIDALTAKRLGSRKIKLTGSRKLKYFVLTIEDNGIGIDEPLLSVIQEPWFSTKGPSHMGMGFSSINEVLSHYPGSTLSIESKKNHFTKISIRLPI